MNYVFIACLIIGSTAIASDKSVDRDYIETQVDVENMSRADMMANGSTLPGKIYRIKNGQTCELTQFAVTIKSESSGLFSVSSSKSYGLPINAIMFIRTVVKGILDLDSADPELFKSIKDEKQNIDLAQMKLSANEEAAKFGAAAINALDQLCSE